MAEEGVAARYPAGSLRDDMPCSHCHELLGPVIAASMAEGVRVPACFELLLSCVKCVKGSRLGSYEEVKERLIHGLHLNSLRNASRVHLPEACLSRAGLGVADIRRALK